MERAHTTYPVILCRPHLCFQLDLSTPYFSGLQAASRTLPAANRTVVIGLVRVGLQMKEHQSRHGLGCTNSPGSPTSSGSSNWSQRSHAEIESTINMQYT